MATLLYVVGVIVLLGCIVIPFEAGDGFMEMSQVWQRKCILCRDCGV